MDISGGMNMITIEITQRECDYINTLIISRYLLDPHIDNEELVHRIMKQAEPQWVRYNE